MQGLMHGMKRRASALRNTGHREVEERRGPRCVGLVADVLESGSMATAERLHRVIELARKRGSGRGMEFLYHHGIRQAARWRAAATGDRQLSTPSQFWAAT